VETPMAIEYRVVSIADVPVLCALPAMGEGGSASPETMLGYLEGTHHPEKALQPRVMYLAAASERPVGYIAGHLTRRYECDGELQWIYVLPEYRGGGVAPRLLMLLAEWFIARGAVRICVDVGHPSGRRFYKKHGATQLNKHWMLWSDISVAATTCLGRL
jgi:GNAT superfamily N-acetyltransferase